MVLAKKFDKKPLNYFSNVIFSDESTFRLCNTSGPQRVWRRNGTRYDEKNIINTEKFEGGGVMAWGFITIDGPGDLHFLSGNMNKQEYERVLETYLLPFLAENSQRNYVFQQDGAPCHTAKTIKKFFQTHEIELLDWAAQSPT